MKATDEAYRKGAVERYGMLDDLDQPLEVSSPQRWLAVVAIALLFGAGLAWALLGSISTEVHGSGTLLVIRSDSSQDRDRPMAVLLLAARDAGLVRVGMSAQVSVAAGASVTTLPGRVVAADQCVNETATGMIRSGVREAGHDAQVCLELSQGASWRADPEPVGSAAAVLPASGSIVVRRERPISFILPVAPQEAK